MKKWMSMTLQQKLIALFCLTSAVILAVNIYTYAIISRMMGRVEDVYISNVNLNNACPAFTSLRHYADLFWNGGRHIHCESLGEGIADSGADTADIQGVGACRQVLRVHNADGSGLGIN